MTGAIDSVLGVKTELAIQQFTSQIPVRFQHALHIAQQIHHCHLQPSHIDDAVASSRRAFGIVVRAGCNFGGYNFLCNNCEHFVNWCACGRRISRQVMMRS